MLYTCAPEFDFLEAQVSLPGWRVPTDATCDAVDGPMEWFDCCTPVHWHHVIVGVSGECSLEVSGCPRVARI